MNTTSPRKLAGMSEIADRYDGYLLDLWGTIHDGLQPLPGVLAALTELKARGKRLLVISNAPRRNTAVIERMRTMGIADHLYDAVLSSGESAHVSIRDRGDRHHAALGRACYHLGPSRDSSVYAELDLDIVQDLESAEFVLNTGLDKPEETVADYAPVLDAAAARGLPMICANPDLVVLRGPLRELCAGALAARYEAQGGTVIYHGKPHAPIYDIALQMLDIEDRSRLIAVGDSLRTDIAGANRIGIDSVLILGGIHAEALSISPGQDADTARLRGLYGELGAAPSYTLPAFIW
ncbi:MAG: TIGR01459 family HAD-type hydrolase [Alphaproteobacteria bacterium]|nr:TIGR01459 family HAD-type hydrolase [Alphaproteobacteria bacterium]